MRFDVPDNVAHGLELHDLVILHGDAVVVLQVHNHDHDVGGIRLQVLDQAGIGGDGSLVSLQLLGDHLLDGFENHVCFLLDDK